MDEHGRCAFAAAAGFSYGLKNDAARRGVGCYVGTILPIRYRWKQRPRQVAPNVFVSLAPSRSRQSLSLVKEGFPPFVREIVSPSSRTRDEHVKVRACRKLGAQEYAIFTPVEGGASRG